MNKRFSKREKAFSLVFAVEAMFFIITFSKKINCFFYVFIWSQNVGRENAFKINVFKLVFFLRFLGSKGAIFFVFFCVFFSFCSECIDRGFLLTAPCHHHISILHAFTPLFVPMFLKSALLLLSSTQSAIPIKIPKRWTMSLYLVVSQTCPTIQAKFRDLGSPKRIYLEIPKSKIPKLKISKTKIPKMKISKFKIPKNNLKT